MEWKVEDAQANFPELVEQALHEERQQIETGEGVVVLISKEELNRIEGKPKSFKEHLLSIPKVDIEFPRDKSPMREFEW